MKKPVMEQDSFTGDLINILRLRPVHRDGVKFETQVRVHPKQIDNRKNQINIPTRWEKRNWWNIRHWFPLDKRRVKIVTAQPRSTDKNGN